MDDIPGSKEVGNFKFDRGAEARERGEWRARRLGLTYAEICPRTRYGRRFSVEVERAR